MRATPRKDTVIFRANWTRILRDGVYVVEDEGKYHGFVVGQTLSRPGALRVKCEDDAQRHQQSAVRALLAERERTPTSQLRQALAAIKENVDTRVRVCPPASMSTWPIGPKKCTWLACRCTVPATFQTACSGDVPICYQKTFEKSFERRRNSLLERRWNTHLGYAPCRWRTSRSTLRTRAPFGWSFVGQEAIHGPSIWVPCFSSCTCSPLPCSGSSRP